MNDFSQRITALTPEQRTLLELRLKQKHNQTSVIPKIVAAKNQHLIASFAQQRMWFQDKIGVNSAISNNMPVALKLHGSLQVNILEQSIKEIIHRHAILRTTLKTVNQQLIQVISPHVDFTLPLIDLRSLPESAREQKAQQLAMEEACRPFDLTGNLFLRVTLLHLDTAEYMMLVTMHHIASDAWSVGVFFRELNLLYQAFASGQPSPLPELSIQYADFATWQRQASQGTQLKKEIDYWKQQLQGAATLLQLPTDRPRSPTPTFAGKIQTFIIPKTLVDALKALSQQAETTLFMTLLAAFKTLLYRYSNQEDILVGSPTANRHQPETENLIGCLINTLVLRSNLSGNPSFWKLLTQEKQVVLDAFAHQNLPFEKLVDELQLGRNLSYLPLFQVLFVMQNATSSRDIELPGVDVEYALIDNQTAQFDITLHVVEEQSALVCRMGYDTGLFDDSTITRLIGHFQTLLAGIVANPHEKIHQLPLLTPTEQQQLFQWNQTATDDPQNICIHQLFTAQVERNPDAVAVVFAGQQLTYRELNNKANQLAHYLRSLGVGGETLVGICLERSLEMAVGFLGILQAGAAYVPLDPSYPPERLAFMLSDSQVPVILTQERLLAVLPQHQAQVVCLDTNWEEISQYSPQNPVIEITPSHLAYVIYTSGSTGQPKGVMITHQGLVNHNLAIAKLFNLEKSDRMLQFASISFDIAVEELFPTWISGAAVVLRNDQMLSSTKQFLEFVEREQVSILDLPTAFWHQLVMGMGVSGETLPKSVRLVVVGGEKVARETYATWLELVGDRCRWINTYGPTETTVVATVYEPSKLESEIPIGRPIANTQIYILDQELQPVPIGVPGEIYIGGVGLARGYLNRPDLTKAKFIPHPFDNSQLESARLYKTGDLARYQADGNIEFIGRIDNQTKIRGFRIELGEIESVLTQHPSILQSVVIDQADQLGNKRLVAYVVAKPENIPTVNDLRYFLEKKLPDYMVPSVFIFLKTLPLNPNGKVDHRALPNPDTHRPELTATFVQPRTSTEAILTQIFAQVIGVNQVGIDDNFFALGGNSLLVIQLINQVSQALSIELTIVDLFAAPTVAGLAKRIERIKTMAIFSAVACENNAGREEIEI